jgi:hypothetical protein
MRQPGLGKVEWLDEDYEKRANPDAAPLKKKKKK